MIKVVLIIYVAILAIMSLTAFIAFGKDKKMAGNGTEVRIKEKTLLALAAYGGALGAFAGRIKFRHKTQKVYFSIVIYLALILQVADLVILLLAFGGFIK